MAIHTYHVGQGNNGASIEAIFAALRAGHVVEGQDGDGWHPVRLCRPGRGAYSPRNSDGTPSGPLVQEDYVIGGWSVATSGGGFWNPHTVRVHHDKAGRAGWAALMAELGREAEASLLRSDAPVCYQHQAGGWRDATPFTATTRRVRRDRDRLGDPVLLILAVAGTPVLAYEAPGGWATFLPASEAELALPRAQWSPVSVVRCLDCVTLPRPLAALWKPFCTSAGPYNHPLCVGKVWDENAPARLDFVAGDFAPDML